MLHNYIDYAISPSNNKPIPMPSGGSQGLPKCIQKLKGNNFVFHIAASPYNHIQHNHTFTIYAIRQNVFFGISHKYGNLSFKILHIFVFTLTSPLLLRLAASINQATRCDIEAGLLTHFLATNLLRQTKEWGGGQ